MEVAGGSIPTHAQVAEIREDGGHACEAIKTFANRSRQFSQFHAMSQRSDSQSIGLAADCKKT
jgi:hypothetical protein